MELASERILNAALFNLWLVEAVRGGGKCPQKFYGWNINPCQSAVSAAMLHVPRSSRLCWGRLSSLTHCNPPALHWSDKETLEESRERLPSAPNYIPVTFWNLEGEGSAVLPDDMHANVRHRTGDTQSVQAGLVRHRKGRIKPCSRTSSSLHPTWRHHRKK